MATFKPISPQECKELLEGKAFNGYFDPKTGQWFVPVE